jgi:hypothetical protein
MDLREMGWGGGVEWITGLRIGTDSGLLCMRS